MNEPKVVITGGAGFIGSHLTEFWTKKDAEVIVIDNLRTGDLNNLKHFSNYKFIEGSITNKDLVFETLEGATYVYNFAAIVSVPESIDNPFECVEINVNGLLNILEASKKHKVKKVIQSSSAAVYGDNPISPKIEILNPQPKSPYGITKLDGEFYLNVYLENFSLKTISLRHFNVFGPRQNPNSEYASAIPIFINKALRNDNIIIYGDGEQTRDFIFINDVVEANYLSALIENIVGVFNIARGEAISVNEIVQNILQITNSKSKVIYEDERKGDIKHSLASIENSKAQLGFSPKFNLNEGLKKTIDYFRQH